MNKEVPKDLIEKDKEKIYKKRFAELEEIAVSNQNINISNKHNASVFYKDKNPVRLMVINESTEIEKCINVALNQYFENTISKDLYDKVNIKSSIVDLKEEPIYKAFKHLYP